MGFFKDLLLKKMLKNQLKGVPEDQQNKIIEAVEKNPKLFADIAAEVWELTGQGKDQMTAIVETLKKHEVELRECMK